MGDIVDRLREEVDYAEDGSVDYGQFCLDAIAEIEKLRRHQSGKDMAAKAYYDNWREAEAKVAEMREALKPFAQSLDSLDARLVRMIDRENIRGRGPDLAITLGDLRRARALADGGDHG